MNIFDSNTTISLHISIASRNFSFKITKPLLDSLLSETLKKIYFSYLINKGLKVG